MKKRAFLISGGAVAGLAATVAVNPIAQSLAAPATINTSAVAVTTKTSTASTTAKSTATKAKATTTKAKATTSSTKRTITGAAVQERYGTVQVSISVTGKKITGINVLQVPGGRNQQFADYAIPTLTQEVLAAQSANVNIVSGASFVSTGFLQSVASAIAKI